MTWVLVIVMVVATVASDLLQSFEMKRAGEQSVGARGVGRLLRMIAARRYLLLSIVCLAFSFFAFMALVQSAPLSFAVPVSASSFILETVLAKILLKEHIGTRRAAGCLLCFAGWCCWGNSGAANRGCRPPFQAAPGELRLPEPLLGSILLASAGQASAGFSLPDIGPLATGFSYLAGGGRVPLAWTS